jgi:hypothetical protein
MIDSINGNLGLFAERPRFLPTHARKQMTESGFLHGMTALCAIGFAILCAVGIIVLSIVGRVKCYNCDGRGKLRKGDRCPICSGKGRL